MPVLGAVCFKLEKFPKMMEICLCSLCTRFPSGWGGQPGTGTLTPNPLCRGCRGGRGLAMGGEEADVPSGMGVRNGAEEPTHPAAPPTPRGHSAHPPPICLSLPSSSSPSTQLPFPRSRSSLPALCTARLHPPLCLAF